MKRRTRDILEGRVRKDMEERNREAGFEMFRYLGLGNGGPYREIRYLYRPRRYSEPVEMSYGGYPFLSDVWLLKDYLEEC